MTRQEKKLQAIQNIGAVKVTHYRVALETGEVGTRQLLKKNNLTPSPRGGVTWVDLYDKHGRFIAEGRADCSEHDNYSRKLGRQIALGRALKKVQ